MCGGLYGSLPAEDSLYRTKHSIKETIKSDFEPFHT